MEDKLGLEIHRSILEYKQAYEMAGIEPFPFRITCKEHKALVEHIKNFMLEMSIVDGHFKTGKINPMGMISYYYGIKIEVVMIVDAYI